MIPKFKDGEKITIINSVPGIIGKSILKNDKFIYCVITKSGSMCGVPEKSIKKNEVV